MLNMQHRKTMPHKIARARLTTIGIDLRLPNWRVNGLNKTTTNSINNSSANKRTRARITIMVAAPRKLWAKRERACTSQEVFWQQIAAPFGTPFPLPGPLRDCGIAAAAAAAVDSVVAVAVTTHITSRVCASRARARIMSAALCN